MHQYRGMGHTTLMVLNLPATPCVIVVPGRNARDEVERILKRERPDIENCMVKIVADRRDVSALNGLNVPVFFDHSMFISVAPEVILEAMKLAVAAARVHDARRTTVAA